MAIAIAGLLLQFYTGQAAPSIQFSDIAPLMFILALWSGGVFAVSAAMRVGEVSVIAPFRYTRLPFGLALGILVFDESVGSNMYLGVAIIVASGFFILKREVSTN